MKILITGAAGMIGRKLAAAIAARGIAGGDVAKLVLADIAGASPPEGFRGETEIVVADLADAGQAAALVAGRPDIVFHLAAVVSGEAELDFDRGYAINLDGTRHLLEAIRAEAARAPYRPRFVFASSIGVFGAPFPERIGDTFFRTPRTSYGTQKAICELLLEDYSRRGILDGIGIRLPTICIRPGAPNKAASGFFSSILREPLAGREAVLPVDESVRHWHASPRSAAGFLLHAAEIDLAKVGDRRILNMPGLSATVAEQIEALRRIAGDEAVRLIRREVDPFVERIVLGWPRDFAPDRALALGFRAERSFDEIIRVHIEDELGGKLP